MKNLKLAFHLRKTLLSVMRPVFAFLSLLYRRLRRHPGQSIAIFLGLVTALLAWLTYQHIVRESEEAKKTTVVLQARIDFNNIYFSNFDYIEVFKPKISFDDPWPEKGSDLGEFRFFGLKPLVWLKILNESRHPITVSHVRGYMSFAKYTGKEHKWFEYFEQGLRERSRFPLFLQSQKEKIVILPFTWPITRAVREWLPKLTTDSLHTARYLVDAYFLSLGEGILGSPGTYQELLKDILVRDLNEQIGTDSSASGEIELKAILSTGEYFTTKIVLP